MSEGPNSGQGVEGGGGLSAVAMENLDPPPMHAVPGCSI